MRKLIPMFDKVLVKRETLQKKGSAIYVPEDTEKKNRPARGEIVAVGSLAGKFRTGEFVELTPGMNIIFSRFAGDQIKDDDQEYWIINDQDVLVIIEDTSEQGA